MTIVTLPTIKVKAGDVITAKAVKSGDLSHCRFDWGPNWNVVSNGEAKERVEYFVVPRFKSEEWRKIGIFTMPKSIRHGLTSIKDTDNLIAIRIRHGVADTVNFLITPEIAIKWSIAARSFGQLFEEYNRILNGSKK